MKSRFCSIFNDSKPEFVHRTLKQFQIKQSLVYSIEFWEPFIHVSPIGENQTNICGPLLGFLIELANIINAK